MIDGLQELISDVKDKLESLEDDTGAKIFKHVDIFRDQFSMFDKNNEFGENTNTAFQWPAAFIEPTVEYVDTSDQGTQRLHVTLSVHCGLWRLDLEKSDNWRLPFTLRNNAQRALQTMKHNDNYSSLMRVIEYGDNTYQNFYVWRLDYMSYVVDTVGYWHQDSEVWIYDNYDLDINIEK